MSPYASASEGENNKENVQANNNREKTAKEERLKPLSSKSAPKKP